MTKKISIFVPCYNEEASLPLFYVQLLKVISGARLSQYDWELLLVNDGSKDNTLEIIKKLREADNRAC